MGRYCGGIIMDLKILPSSMRPKKRYLVFEIISETPVALKDFYFSAWNSFISNLGTNGAADSKIWIIQNLYDEKAQKGIIRCTSASVEKVRSALSLITIVGESRSIVRVMGVTGTIKSAKAKYTNPSLKKYV
jgi:ribonuclease P/MRP protein subunit POP5